MLAATFKKNKSMTNRNILIERVNHLLKLADKTLDSTYTKDNGLFSSRFVNPLFHKEFETSSLSFIINIYGENHPYYSGFENCMKNPTPESILNGKGILNSINTEIDKGWLITLKGLVAAEIFTDFIETAEYLLSQNYKDASAVIIGSTLEEHLRQLCRKNSIDTQDEKNGKRIHKKAESINSELAKKSIYSILDQKNITAWLDLRNKAAHGKYNEYTIEQVELMITGIQNFLSRNQI